MYHNCSSDMTTLWCSKQIYGAIGNSGNSENDYWEQHNILKLKDWNSGNSGNSKFSKYKSISLADTLNRLHSRA